MESGHNVERDVNDRQVDVRTVGKFLALTFGLSWTSGLLLYLAGIELGTVRGLVLTTVLFMWAPGIAAIGVRLSHGE